MEIGAKFKVTIKVEDKDTAMSHGSGTLAVLLRQRRRLASRQEHASVPMFIIFVIALFYYSQMQF